ncbi:MAG: DUF1786 family protein [Kouleothrix sp.]
MRILMIDIGMGTGRYSAVRQCRPNREQHPLVMPAPTQIVAQAVRAATAGVYANRAEWRGIMGGGPCHWAVEDHLRAGLPAVCHACRCGYLQRRPRLGGARDGRAAGWRRRRAGLAGGCAAVLGDLNLAAIEAALAAFGVRPDFDGLAVAVFDHGNAPPEISDRVFRFNYLAERFSTGGGLLALGFRADDVPAEMTRLRAVAAAAPAGRPALLMDTAPAAVLGALDDRQVAVHDDLLLVNVGNFHCLAFHLSGGAIVGCFEHHTGELTTAKLETLLERLASGAITNHEVFASMGHGALVLRPTPNARPFLAVTGPRRAMLRDTTLWAGRPYMAVPHGAMMLAGCFGLLRAYAANYPAAADAITAALAST